MVMSGTVFEINAERGLVAILTKEYGFTIVELLDDEEEIEVGDLMRWQDDTALGNVRLSNVSRGTTIDVSVQNHWVSEAELRQQLLLD